MWVASPSRGPCRTLRRGPGGGLGTHPATHQLGRVRQPLRCSGLQPPHFESTPAGLDDVGGTLPGQSGPPKEGHLTQGGGGGLFNHETPGLRSCRKELNSRVLTGSFLIVTTATLNACGHKHIIQERAPWPLGALN